MKTAVIIATVIIVISGVLGNLLTYADVQPSRLPQFAAIPLLEGPYAGDERRFSDASYDVLRADTSTLRLYYGPGGTPVWLFVAYFSSQKYGSQIHSPMNCLPGGGWRIESLVPRELPLPGGGSMTINEVLISDGAEYQLMHYWFETRSGVLRSEYMLKIDLAKSSLLFNPTDAAFVRVTMPIENGNTSRAREYAFAFIQQFYDDITQALPF